MLKRVMILAAIAFVFGGAFSAGLENAACTRLMLSGNGSQKKSQKDIQLAEPL